MLCEFYVGWLHVELGRYEEAAAVWTRVSSATRSGAMLAMVR